MSYNSCIKDVAASIAKNCDKPQVGGYTGRGVLIQLSDAPTFTVSADNPRTINGISLAEGKKAIAIDNVWSEPFSGSTTASNADNGRIGFTKTFAFRIPLRGSDVSRDIVEPLSASALGFVAVLEKKDRSGNGSFEVVGYQNGLTTNADGISRDEAANDGDISVTMSTSEPWFEVVLFATDYASSLEAFEALLAKAY